MTACRLILFYLFFLLAGATGSVQAAGPFANVSDSTQKARDDKRVEILNGELVQEQRALAQAKIAEVEAANRKGTAAELDEARELVGRHERNIEAITREINLVTKKSGVGQSKAVVRVVPVAPASAVEDVPYWDTFRRGPAKDTVKAVVREAPGAPANASEEVPYWDTFRRKQPSPVSRD